MVAVSLKKDSLGMVFTGGAAGATRTKSDAEVTGKDLDTAWSVAVLLHKQGHTAEAKRMYEEVIVGRTAMPGIGADHVDTLRAKGNLAILLNDQGQ
eukprot:SAG22_NODE_17660_length_300_cov_2.288557_1_plen_95_part_10